MGTPTNLLFLPSFETLCIHLFTPVPYIGSLRESAEESHPLSEVGGSETCDGVPAWYSAESSRSTTGVRTSDNLKNYTRQFEGEERERRGTDIVECTSESVRVEL
jgi:hypothetical protein